MTHVSTDAAIHLQISIQCFFSFVRKLCGLYEVRKDIIGHGTSNGWLHFVDLFRLSDADIERTIICTALWRNLGIYKRHGLVSGISFHATLNGSVEDRRTLKTRSRHALTSRKKTIDHLYGTTRMSFASYTRTIKRIIRPLRSLDIN